MLEKGVYTQTELDEKKKEVRKRIEEERSGS